MKKKIVAALVVIGIIAALAAGCSEASRVESNLTKEADNFNVVRQLTVINCLQGGCIIPNDRENVYYSRR